MRKGYREERESHDKNMININMKKRTPIYWYKQIHF